MKVTLLNFSKYKFKALYFNIKVFFFNSKAKLSFLHHELNLVDFHKVNI